MISLYDINKAMIDHLKDNWTYTSIREINEGDAPDLPFIECYLLSGMMDSLEIQGAAARYGVFIIKVYTKKGGGVDKGNSFTGKLEAMFWDKDIGVIGCTTPYSEPNGVNNNREAYEHQTTVPFYIITEK